MENDLIDAMVRMRHKFFIKDSQEAGFLGSQCHSIRTKKTSTERGIDFIATTQDVDLDGEVVLASGADWSYMDGLGCKSFYLDHRYDSDHHIGTIRSRSPYMLGGEHVGWKMSSMIYPGLKCHKADDFYTKCQYGPMGISIGFIPLDRRPPTPEDRKKWPTADVITTRWMAIECSGTGSPCNLKAHTMPVLQEKARKTVLIPNRVVEI